MSPSLWYQNSFQFHCKLIRFLQAHQISSWNLLTTTTTSILFLLQLLRLHLLIHSLDSWESIWISIQTQCSSYSEHSNLQLILPISSKLSQSHLTTGNITNRRILESLWIFSWRVCTLSGKSTKIVWPTPQVSTEIWNL